MKPRMVAWHHAFKRDHWLVFSFASLAWLFDCFCQQAFNLARGGAVEQLVADPGRAQEFASYTNSFLLVGWAVGGLIFGALGDHFGRARILRSTLFIYAVGTGACSFAGSYALFCVCLFCTGVGVGGVFGLAVALVADAVPTEGRAPALGLLQSLATWGNVSAGVIGFGLSVAAGKGLLPFGLKYWQAIFLAGAAPALACGFLTRGLAEPERWVQARAAGMSQGIRFGSYRHLLSHPTWSRHAWAGLGFCGAGIVGLWGIGNFHPAIVSAIVQQGLSRENLTPAQLASAKAHWSATALVLQNLGGFVGMLCLAKLAQTKGRKFALGWGLVASFLSTVLVLKFLQEMNQIFWMIPLMGFGQLGVFAVYAIYLPELFPTSLRSTGTSFCYNFGRLVAATAPFTLGQLTKHLGGNIESFRSAGLWISLVLLAGLIPLPFLPETKGHPLPAE